MFLIKSWVILSNSSTSFIERGTPPEGAAAPGIEAFGALGAGGLVIDLLCENDVGDGAGLVSGATGGGSILFSWLTGEGVLE